jgi:hypothetical protein
MKRAILNTFIFILPVVLFFSFPVLVIFLSREYLSPKDVVLFQNIHKDALYRNRYNTGSFIPYKKALFEMRDPDIFMLGSSRALQARKDFFNLPESYMNAGLAGKTFDDMRFFIESIPSSGKHRTLLLVIDREMFLTNPSLSNGHEDDSLSLFGFHFNLPLKNARGIYLDYFVRKKYSFKDLVASYYDGKTLGIVSFMDGNGFRSDGSYRNYIESKDPTLSKNVITESNGIAKNILEIRDNFPAPGPEYISGNLKILQEVLELSKSKNITVIGFIPPYMTSINHATLDPHSLNGGMYRDMTNQIAETFKNEHVNFYDLSDISLYGGSDSEFLDTVHGTDVLYAKLSLYLAEHDVLAGKLFNSAMLKRLIKNSKNGFLQ